MHDIETSLLDVVQRQVPPEPWAEGDNIPWHEPDFSERMLREHLSQEHDLASRRTELIDEHVAWLHRDVLGSGPGRVLDLGCGPGLYLHRLARLGHEGTGFDIGPASVRYAQKIAAAEELACRFEHADLRNASFGRGFDLAMILYGQINVFRREEAEDILRRAHEALAPGGRLVLEMQTWAQVASAKGAPPTWHTAPSGLFSDHPHLVLHERSWDATREVATERWFVVDAKTGRVRRYALSNEAYDEAAMTALLGRIGFAAIEHRPALPGGDADGPMSVVVATSCV